MPGRVDRCEVGSFHNPLGRRGDTNLLRRQEVRERVVDRPGRKRERIHGWLRSISLLSRRYGVRQLTSVEAHCQKENGARFAVFPSADTVLANAIGRGTVAEIKSL